MNPNDQKDTTSDTQVSPWYTNFLLPAGLIFLLLLAGALYFGYQSYSASKVPKLPTESPSNINYPQVSASGVTFVKSEATMNTEWYNEAYRSGNIKICEKITNPDRKISCKNNVTAGNAIKTRNIALCDQITVEEEKIGCRNPLYSYEAIATNNIELCKKITGNDSYQDGCISKVTMNQIAQNNTGTLTIDICKNIADEFGKNNCIKEISAKNNYDAYQLAKSAHTLDSCDSVNDSSLRNICKDKVLFSQAQENKDILLCEKISEASKKQRCIGIVSNNLDELTRKNAVASGKIEMCLNIENSNTKQICMDEVYYKQALETKNKDMCEKIQSSQKQSKCLSYITQ